MFNINEGNKIRIKNIVIDGNTRFSDKEIQKQFNNLKIFNPFLFWRGKFNIEDFNNELILLRIFYKNQGYRDFEIINKEIVYRDSGIDIYLNLYEGEQYHYNSILFEGNYKFTDEELLEKLNIDINDLYNEEKLNIAVYDVIKSLYTAKNPSYLYALFDPFFSKSQADSPSFNKSFNIAFFQIHGIVEVL